MNLQEVLTDTLGDSVKRRALQKLIKKCHGMALAYLRMKAASNKLYMIRGERLEDLAWDFIAELFEKDESGKLIRLQEYFDEPGFEQLSNSDLTMELRKLVFTKVEDNIFRAVGEKDPSLRKIIRNLKIAIRENDCKQQFRYEKGYLVQGKNEEVSLPIMPSEFMEIRLSSRLEEKMQIPEILNEAIEILRQQDRYQKRISLVALASVIRLAFVHLNEPVEDQKNQHSTDEAVKNAEFEKFLDASSERIRISTGYSYVRNGKITRSELDTYIKAAKDIVNDHFSDGKTEASQYEYLKIYIPDLEYEDFRSENRPVLEYLVKLIRKDLVETFKEDWV